VLGNEVPCATRAVTIVEMTPCAEAELRPAKSHRMLCDAHASKLVEEDGDWVRGQKLPLTTTILCQWGR
jgi:hypothetical protein